jgi:hypothetical protein
MLLGVVSMLSYIVLGYFIHTNDTHAHKTVERMILLGNVKADGNAMMMELRGYQLIMKQDFLDRYKDKSQSLDKNLLALQKLVLAKANADRITVLMSLVDDWEKGNGPRFEILSRHGKEIYFEGFGDTQDGKKLAELTTLSAERFKVIVQKQEELAKSVEKLIWTPWRQAHL